MKKVFIQVILLVSAIISLNASYAETHEQALDQIVAIVNDDVVTKAELTHAVSIAKMQIAQENISAPSEKKIEEQLLDQLINKKLQLQMAKQVGISLTDADLDKAIARIASMNNVTVDELYARLSQEGMTKKDYRQEMQDQLIMQKLQQQEVIAHININPDDVENFKKSKAKSRVEKEYQVEDLLIPMPETPSSEQLIAANRFAARLVAKMKKGESVQQVVKTQSTDTYRLENNDLGWRKLEEVPTIFAQEIAQMHAKQVAGPIKAPNGLHILYVKGMHAISKQEAAPERKQVEQMLMQRKFEDAMLVWLSKLRSQAFIVTNPEK